MSPKRGPYAARADKYFAAKEAEGRVESFKTGAVAKAVPGTARIVTDRAELAALRREKGQADARHEY